METKSSICSDDIKRAIISHPGPFVTAKLVYGKFSSRIRPDVETVKNEMRYLEEIGLGNIAQVDRFDYFCKALPNDVQSDSLSKFEISAEEYKAIFNSVDSALTYRQRLWAETSHPNEEFAEYTASQEERLPVGLGVADGEN